MENVLLTVHLILALLLIGVVLLQRSEGGGLGMGSGGGGGGVMTGRQAANALSKLTWILAAAFLATSLTLTILAARNAIGASVLDQIGTAPEDRPVTPGLAELPDYTPPPGVGEPVAPPAPDAPVDTPVEATPPAGDAPVDVPPPAPAAPVETAPATPEPATTTGAAPAPTLPAGSAPAAEGRVITVPLGDPDSN